MVRVQDLMSTDVQTISPSASAVEAWELMRRLGIHHLVVTEGRRLAGVISDRDAGGRKGAAVRRHANVADLMTPNVVTVPPDAPVRKAANLMRGRSIGCLVVTRGDRPIGIITVSDLLEAIGRGMERPVVATKRWTLRHRGLRPRRPAGVRR